jgi:hypothetical protein
VRREGGFTLQLLYLLYYYSLSILHCIQQTHTKSTPQPTTTPKTTNMPSFKGSSHHATTLHTYPNCSTDSISSTPAGPSSAPTPQSTSAAASTHDTLHAASAALSSQGLDLCPHCFREMSHCNERFEFA